MPEASTTRILLLLLSASCLQAGPLKELNQYNPFVDEANIRHFELPHPMDQAPRTREVLDQILDVYHFVSTTMPETTSEERKDLTLSTIANYSGRSTAEFILWLGRRRDAVTRLTPAEQAEIALFDGDLSRAKELAEKVIADESSTMRTALWMPPESRAVAKHLCHRIMFEVHNQLGNDDQSLLEWKNCITQLPKSDRLHLRAWFYFITLKTKQTPYVKPTKGEIFDKIKQRYEELNFKKAPAYMGPSFALGTAIRYVEIGDHKKAEAAFVEALLHSEKMLGGNNIFSLAIRRVTATWLASVESHQRSKENIQCVLDVLGERLGAGSKQLAKEFEFAASVTEEMSDYQASSELWWQALSIHRFNGNSLENQALCLAKLCLACAKSADFGRCCKAASELLKLLEGNPGQFPRLQTKEVLAVALFSTSFTWDIDGKLLYELLDDGDGTAANTTRLEQRRFMEMHKSPEGGQKLMAEFEEMSKLLDSHFDFARGGSAEAPYILYQAAVAALCGKISEAESHIVRVLDLISVTKKTSGETHSKEADIVMCLRHSLRLKGLSEAIIEQRVRAILR
jgi:tetratricopeptide (TPR) repeat protein